ncbi:MAG TPA: DUF2784 domain-containing protein [Planctomycetaceae bacterium]|nr:DUF2784 domain-containing protein [Planctomycetaceae bacterium]
MSLYRLLADLIVVIHAGYVGFVVLGVPAILFGAWRGYGWARNFWFRGVHLLMIGVVALESIFGILCPLTEWEDQLRASAGQDVEEGSFIGRWTHELIFVDLSPGVLTACYCLFAAVVIGLLFLIPPRRPAFLKRR